MLEKYLANQLDFKRNFDENFSENNQTAGKRNRIFSDKFVDIRNIFSWIVIAEWKRCTFRTANLAKK